MFDEVVVDLLEVLKFLEFDDSFGSRDTNIVQLLKSLWK